MVLVVSLFRLQDPEETDISFRMSDKEGSFSNKFLQFINYKPMKRCLMYVIIDGDPDYTKISFEKSSKSSQTKQSIRSRKISCQINGWSKRYSSAHLRDL